MWAVKNVTESAICYFISGGQLEYLKLLALIFFQRYKDLNIKTQWIFSLAFAKLSYFFVPSLLKSFYKSMFTPNTFEASCLKVKFKKIELYIDIYECISLIINCCTCKAISASRAKNPL